MKNYLTKSPVVMMVYNRPQKTALVFEEIARVKPKRLFVIADGPKQSKEDEKKCAETRKIVENVNWECQVVKFFSETNLGCRQRVSTGLDSVFRETDRAIIIEDDCLPSANFFYFCDEMLEKYRDNQQIGHISGCNLLGSDPGSCSRYYFSRYPHIWGWATWQRAWNLYDVSMRSWSEASGREFLRRFCDTRGSIKFWYGAFCDIANQKIDTWDFQWVFALWYNDLLSITPRLNMVNNIGFDIEATHTKMASLNLDLSVWTDDFDLTCHPAVQRDAVADLRMEKLSYTAPTLLERIVRRLRNSKIC